MQIPFPNRSQTFYNITSVWRDFDATLGQSSATTCEFENHETVSYEIICGASSQLLFAYCPQTNNPPPHLPAHAAPREINYLLRSADFSRRDVSSFPLRCRVFPRCPLLWPRRATLPTLNLRPTNLSCIRAYNGVLLTSKTNGLPMVYQLFTDGLQWFTSGFSMVCRTYTSRIFMGVLVEFFFLEAPPQVVNLTWSQFDKFIKPLFLQFIPQSTSSSEDAYGNLYGKIVKQIWKLSHHEFVQSPTILKRVPNSLFI